MNTLVNISYNQAIFITLFSAFLWGTWPISQKFLNKYPMKAFFLEVFFFSLIFVWLLSFIVKGNALIEEIKQVFLFNPSLVIVTGICGFLFSVAMILNFYIISLIGLTISQPIQQTIGLLVGATFTVFIGGTPPNLSIVKLIISLSLLIFSIFFAYLSHKSKEKITKKNVKFYRIILLSVFGSAVGSSYAFSISYSLKTILNPNGLGVLSFTSIFVLGAFLFMLILNLIKPPKDGLFKTIKNANYKIHLLSVLAALFHYGGNMLHCLSTGLLSSVVSWPLGLTSGLWTQLGGFILGEFKKAKKSSYVFWALSIIFYIIGARIII